MERWFCETVKEMTRMEVLLQDKESVNLSILWILCSFTFFCLCDCLSFCAVILQDTFCPFCHWNTPVFKTPIVTVFFSLIVKKKKKRAKENEWSEEKNEEISVSKFYGYFFLVVGRPFSSLWRDQHIWREHWTPYYVALVIFVVLSFLALKTWVFGDNIEKLTERTHLEKEAHRSACVYVPEKEEPRPWSSEKKREEEQYSMLFQWWFTSRSLVSS